MTSLAFVAVCSICPCQIPCHLSQANTAVNLQDHHQENAMESYEDAKRLHSEFLHRILHPSPSLPVASSSMQVLAGACHGAHNAKPSSRSVTKAWYRSNKSRRRARRHCKVAAVIKSASASIIKIVADVHEDEFQPGTFK